VCFEVSFIFVLLNSSVIVRIQLPEYVNAAHFLFELFFIAGLVFFGFICY
jgi:hypothetical protein